MTRVALALAAVLAAVALSACGESDADKAKTTVCDARQDMSAQVSSLKSLTPQTFNTDAVSTSLSAITADLSKIVGAQADLSDERRAQVKSANQTFASQVEGVVKGIGSGTSADELEAAVQQLVASYQQTFAKVDC